MALLFLDLISKISFAFSLVSIVFIILYNLKLPVVILFIILGLAFFNLYFKNKNKVLFYLSHTLFISLLFPPFGATEKVFLIIISLYTIYVVNTETNINYGFAVDYFKRTSSLGLLTFVISFLMRFISTSKFNTIENLVIPALLLYFVTTVFLLRILRSLEYKPEDKKIISINIRYAFLFIILSFSLSVPFIRDKLFYAFNFLFSLLFWGFTSLISVVFIIVAYIGGKIAYYILSFLASSDVLSRTMGREVKLSPILKDITRLLRERPNIQSDFLDNVLRISYYILVIGGVIFIIFWILRRVRNSAKREENYIEEKEFILPSINPIQKLFSLFRGSNLGVIREYYRKYLLESREKGVEINPSDTTFDIYNKTLYIFDSNATKRMRDIYIRVRYGLENISSELSKEFISLYESLHKKK